MTKFTLILSLEAERKKGPNNGNALFSCEVSPSDLSVDEFSEGHVHPESLHAIHWVHSLSLILSRSEDKFAAYRGDFEMWTEKERCYPADNASTIASILVKYGV